MAYTVSNADIRNHAAETTKQNLMVILLMTLITAAFPGSVQFMITLIYDLFRLPATYLAYRPAGYIFLIILGFVVYAHFSFLAWAIMGSFPVMGLDNGILRLIRRQDANVGMVFSRFSSIMKGFLLNLYVGLRVLVWMLPGLSLIAIGMFVHGFFGGLLIFSGVGLVGFLAGPPAVRYCMALPALAEQPSLGVMGAFRKSAALMEGRKWQFCRLILPYAAILAAAVLSLYLTGWLLAKLHFILAVPFYLGIAAVSLLIGSMILVIALTFYAVYAETV